MKMHRLRGIHFVFIYLSCALLCATVVYFYLPRIEYALFKDFARERQHTVCRIVSGELNSTLEKTRLVLKAEAHAPDVLKAVQEAHSTRVMSHRFGELIRLFEGMDAYRAPALDFLLINGRGDIIDSSGLDRGNRSAAPYFADAMQGKSSVKILGVSPRTGGPVMRVAEPVLSGGVPVGVLAMTLDLGKITDGWRVYLQDVSRQAVFLMDAKGKILVHSNIAKLGMQLEDAEDLLRGTPGEHATVEYVRDGEIQMLTYMEMPQTGWTVAVSSSETAMFTGEGFSGGFDAIVFAAVFLVLLFVVCVPLQAVFYVMHGKAITHEQKALLLQSMEDGIIALGADGVIAYMNSAAEGIVRAPGDLLAGSHVHSAFRFSRFDEQSAVREGSPLLPHLQAGTSAQFHGHLLWRADGSSFVGDVSLYPVDTGTKPGLFMLRLRDVTNERDAEERIRAVSRVMDNVFMEWDEHLQLLGCTEECARLFGARDAQDLVDGFFYRFSPSIQPDGSVSSQAGIQALKRAFEQGFYRCIWRHRTLDGAPLLCEITMTRLLHGGRPRILVHARDLRFLLECMPPDALHARLWEGIDAMPVGMGILVAGECRFANPALRTMAGIQAGAPVSSTLMNALGAPREDVKADACAQGVCVCLSKPIGGTGDFLLNSAPVEYEGESGVVFCLADISEQKRLERELIAARETAEAATSARGRFVAMVSHEVRTPLNGIMGLLQLASLLKADGELKGHLDTAFSLCGDLLRILNDILDFSKMESGTLSMQVEEFSLDAAVRAALVPFQKAARDKNIALHWAMDPALPDRLSGDVGRVHQLLLNLVGNAVKYTQAGRITLEVLRMPAHGASACRVLFAVSDTGVGISAERMGGIYDPFQRGDDGYVLRQSGVGLGMPIVRRLVLLMGGELCVFSREGQGTENHLILPFMLPLEAETAPESADLEENENRSDADYCAWSADTPRILVVDDDAINVITMQLLLAALGYPTDVADNGPLALDMLRERRYGLVFMDIQMPGMDGYEATAAIRTVPGLDALPIVAFTAHAMQGDREKMLSRGFDEYLAKPVMADDLKTLLHRMLGR